MKETYRTEKKERAKIRRQHLVQQAHVRREANKEKNQFQKEKLYKVHFISTSEELDEALAKINTHCTTATKKAAETCSFLKMQVKFCKSILRQDISIKFSRSGRQRPLVDVIKEISEFISSNLYEYSAFLKNPSVLVGKMVDHRFELVDSYNTRWYKGTVLSFDEVTELHTVV